MLGGLDFTFESCVFIEVNGKFSCSFRMRGMIRFVFRRNYFLIWRIYWRKVNVDVGRFSRKLL